jgi:hypothetical protein
MITKKFGKLEELCLNMLLKMPIALASRGNVC